MSFQETCDVIMISSSYLAHREVGECKVFLYYADGFYVEVYYSSKHAKVIMINAFDKVIGLDPYLNQISILDLEA